MKKIKKFYTYLILMSCSHHDNSDKSDIIFLRNITVMFFLYWSTINLFIALVFPDSFLYKYMKNFVISSSVFLPISFYIINTLFIKNYNMTTYYYSLLKYPKLRDKLKIQFYLLYIGIFVFLVSMLYYFAE